jgi:hypothetical protein
MLAVEFLVVYLPVPSLISMLTELVRLPRGENILNCIIITQLLQAGIFKFYFQVQPTRRDVTQFIYFL